MMFKLIKYDIYGCEVSFAVELPLYLKPSFKHVKVIRAKVVLVKEAMVMKLNSQVHYRFQ